MPIIRFAVPCGQHAVPHCRQLFESSIATRSVSVLESVEPGARGCTSHPGPRACSSQSPIPQGSANQVGPGVPHPCELVLGFSRRARFSVGSGAQKLSNLQITMTLNPVPWASCPRVPELGNTFFGEFDHGSGRTLAACLKHASRTE